MTTLSIPYTWSSSLWQDMTIVHIWSFRIWCMTKEFSKKEKRPIKFKTRQKDKNLYGLFANFTPPNSILSLILSMNFSQSQEVHKTLSFQLKRSYFFQNVFFWYLWWHDFGAGTWSETIWCMYDIAGTWSKRGQNSMTSYIISP